MTRYDDDLTKKEFHVELYHQQLGRLGSGTLHFNTNQWRSFELSSPDPISKLYKTNAKLNLIKAVTDSGAVFTLCYCKTNGFILSPDYVIEDDLDEAKFESIRVRYNDISEWFLRWRKVEGAVGETLTWTQIPKDIDVVVKTDTEHFGLRSEYRSFQCQQGEDIIIHERMEFIFSAKGNHFSLADVKEKIHELSCLFSVLLAYSITTDCIWVNHGTGYHRIYFPTFKKPERDLNNTTFVRHCFIQQPDLEGRWQIIFNNYYKSQYRKLCWTRLAGMLRYDGFWEYRVLGYISILDRYLTIRCKEEKWSGLNLSQPRRINEFCQDLAKKMPDITDEQRDKIIEIASKSFASKSRRLDFKEKYSLVVETIDHDIVKIINLTDYGFQTIKKICNEIAHGDDYDLNENNISIIMQSIGKIILILMYEAFMDFGLTKRDFINCLKTTASKLKFFAVLDNVHLDRVTGSAEFFSIAEKEKFLRLRDIHKLRVFGCCIEDEDGELNFSEEFTDKFLNWRNNPDKISHEQKSEEIFGISNEKARCVGQGYFEYGNEYFRVVNMWIIKK